MFHGLRFKDHCWVYKSIDNHVSWPYNDLGVLMKKQQEEEILDAYMDTSWIQILPLYFCKSSFKT